MQCMVFLYSVFFCVIEYTEIGGDEELPLGDEFQEHLRRFLHPNEKKIEKRLELVKKLVTQLSCVQRLSLTRCSFLLTLSYS